MSVEPRLDAWLAVLDERDGTDILLTHDSPPLLRVDGRLTPLADAEPLTGEEIEVISRNQIKDQYGDRLHVGREVDFSFSWRNLARIRANAFYQRGHCSLSLRRIPMKIPTPTELGIPLVMAGILRNPSGLLLVTGPTGSGKSTTMAAMVDAINHARSCHIVTIEDPIEYLHTNVNSAVSQREVGTDTESFDKALRSALREDPDVVMVGEMRDLKSISAALTIAETGHLVLATMHTNDSAQTIDRIVDVFPADRRPQIRSSWPAPCWPSSTSAWSRRSTRAWSPPTRSWSASRPCATWSGKARPVSCATSSPLTGPTACRRSSRLSKATSGPG